MRCTRASSPLRGFSLAALETPPPHLATGRRRLAFSSPLVGKWHRERGKREMTKGPDGYFFFAGGLATGGAAAAGLLSTLTRVTSNNSAEPAGMPGLGRSP